MAATVAQELQMLLAAIADEGDRHAEALRRMLQSVQLPPSCGTELQPAERAQLQQRSATAPVRRRSLPPQLRAIAPSLQADSRPAEPLVAPLHVGEAAGGTCSGPDKPAFLETSSSVAIPRETEEVEWMAVGVDAPPRPSSPGPATTPAPPSKEPHDNLLRVFPGSRVSSSSRGRPVTRGVQARKKGLVVASNLTAGGSDPSCKQTTVVQQLLNKKRVLLSNRLGYEAFILMLIALNAVFVGWQTNESATNSNRHAREVSMAVGLVFVVIFGADVVFRIWQQRKSFFTGPDMRWNSFDLCVVLVTSIDVMRRILDTSRVSQSTLSVLRFFRLLRLVRLMHVWRVATAFEDFQVIVDTMCYICTAFKWLIFVLIMMLYVVAVAITDGTIEHCMGPEFAEDAVCLQFGTVERSAMSVYQAMFGGLLWGELVHSLGALDTVYPIMLFLFISFALIVFLNTITAMCVAMQSKAQSMLDKNIDIAIAHEDRAREELLQMLQKAFNENDVNGSGDIGIEEFRYMLTIQKIRALFTQLQLDISDPDALFNLFDYNHSGAVEMDEFVNACLRLKGGASVVDVKQVQVMQHDILDAVDELWNLLQDATINADDETTPTESSAQSKQRNKWEDMLASDQTVDSIPRLPSRNKSFKGIAAKSGPCRIECSEKRAMTLAELRGVSILVKDQCEGQQWHEFESGALLRPQDVNLYHLSHFHILPETVPDGVFLLGLESSKCSPGDRVTQPQKLVHAEGYVEAVLDNGSIHVRPTHGRFMPAANCIGFPQGGADGCVDLGQVESVLSDRSLSYKELVGDGPRTPRWYCCHWWGHSVLDFVASCELHASMRNISTDDASYWVCGYANNQHHLLQEITDDPKESSFFRAMQAADGVLLILDSDATPFKRIWCAFELYRTISDEYKLLDITTTSNSREGQASAPQLITEGLLPNETRRQKVVREKNFPRHLLIEGIHRRLEDGDCSVHKDKEQILKCIAQDTEEGPDDFQSKLQASLKRANNALNSSFALAAWPFAVEKSDVRTCNHDSGHVSLPDVLRQDEARKRLQLSLALFDQVTNVDVIDIAHGLPPNLEELDLSFQRCRRVTDSGLHCLAQALPRNLQHLRLSFLGCPELTDNAVQVLAQRLPPDLKSLHLDLAMCSEITESSLVALHAHMPGTLRELSVILTGTPVDSSVKSVQQLREIAKILGNEPRRRKLVNRRRNGTTNLPGFLDT